MQTYTRDAIQDIWGPRTGYKHQWPTRVDEHQIEEPAKWVQSACVLCSNGCGMDIGVKDGKMVAVRGRAADRVNKGRLGPKGLYAWQSLQHEERLQYPMIRRNGKLERASWDEVMTLIVERTKQTHLKLTNHGIAFYTSGQLFLEEYYALAMVGKAGLNTLHMDGNTRLCTATAAASMRESFGADGQPGSYTDIDFTSCIMLVGHNMSATQTVLWSRILDRLAGPDPPEIIVIDPRKSNCAARATLHLAPRIGTNCALLNGLEYLLFEKGYVNEGYVTKHVYGRDVLYNTVKHYPPERVAEITGVPAEDIRRAADMIGKSKSLLSTCLQGVYQSNQATASACQVNNINLLLGHIGKPGAGIFQMNGQPTAQNNREAGCDGEYPAFRNFNNKNHMQELADLWNIDYIKLPHWAQPTHVQNLLKYIDSGTIEMLWVSGTNPLVSLPNLPKIRKTFTKDNLFLIVQDIFNNETTAIADVVLPAAAWGEKTGTFTNVDRTVHISYKAVEPPGEARADFDIFVDYAKRMDFRGKDGTPLMPWNDPSEAFEAWKRVSRGRPCDYSGLTYEKLSGGSGLQWPCNEKYPFGKERLFDDGIFFTDTEYAQTFGHDLETGAPVTKAEYQEMNVAGRAILKACHYLPEFEPINDEYPFQLSTGRRTRQFHTRTKTGRTVELQSASPNPCIQISVDDAEDLNIKNGEIVLVESRRGKVEIPAKLGNISRGQTFIPFHYGYFDDVDGRARAANELTQERWDPISKQPMFKSGAVKITKIVQENGEVKIHAPEPQSAVVRIAEAKNKRYESRMRDEEYSPPKLERMMEYWLAALSSALSTLENVCAKTVPKTDHSDYEISSGMQGMQRIAKSCRDRLRPYTIQYPTELGHSYNLASLIKDCLFPEERAGDFSGSASYDALILLQSFYMYLNLCEGHVIALKPTAMAAWDEEFLEAIEFVGDQVERMNKWARQQLSTRGPQCLLVPCKEAVGMGRRLSTIGTSRRSGTEQRIKRERPVDDSQSTGGWRDYGLNSRCFVNPDLESRNSSSIYVVNKQIRQEAIDVAKSVEWHLDLVVYKQGVRVLPTWTYISRPSNLIDILKCTIRLHGTFEYNQRKDPFRGGCGGPALFIWVFYELMTYFFEHGPSLRASNGDKQKYLIEKLIIDIQTPELEENMAWFPNRDGFTDAQLPKTRMLSAETLYSFLSGHMGFLLSCGNDTGSYGAPIFAHTGSIEFRVDGNNANTHDLDSILTSYKNVPFPCGWNGRAASAHILREYYIRQMWIPLIERLRAKRKIGTAANKKLDDDVQEVETIQKSTYKSWNECYDLVLNTRPETR